MHGLGQLGTYQSEKASCDLQIPVMNRTAASLVRSYAGSLTLSVESSAAELSHVGEQTDAVVVYGKIPVMTTRQCLQKEGIACHKGAGNRILTLKDRKDETWTAELHCGTDCYNVLYTGKPIWMADRSKTLKKTGAGIWRLMFLDEDTAQITEVLQAYQDAAKGLDVQEAPKNTIRGQFFKPCL